MDSVEKLLEELTNAYGAVGFEEGLRKIMRRELAELCDSVDTDEMGSLLAKLRGGVASPRVMIAAHMDEVSLMVKYITPEGFIKFDPLGAWLDHALINQRFVILTHKGEVHGVTGLKSAHFVDDEQKESLIFQAPQIFIDVGATSRQDAMERLDIKPGDPIVPNSKFASLGGGQLYLAKAFDDRVGLAVIVETMRLLVKNPPPNALYSVSTVQEEVGSRGAHTSVYQAKPDIAINLEAGAAADYPSTSEDDAEERLGAGPTLFMHDSSMLPNLRFRKFVIEIAQKQGIPLQYEVIRNYGDDSDEIQRAFSGVPTVTIGVPTRYLHNHNGVISRQDFDNTVKLMAAVISRLDAETVRRIRSFN